MQFIWKNDLVKYYVELKGNQKLNTKKTRFNLRARIQYILKSSLGHFNIIVPDVYERFFESIPNFFEKKRV